MNLTQQESLLSYLFLEHLCHFLVLKLGQRQPLLVEYQVHLLGLKRLQHSVYLMLLCLIQFFAVLAVI